MSVCYLLQESDWAFNQLSGRQKLTLDLTPAAERPNKLLAGYVAAKPGMAHVTPGQPPDSPAYRSGVDIDFLRQHDVELI